MCLTFDMGTVDLEEDVVCYNFGEQRGVWDGPSFIGLLDG